MLDWLRRKPAKAQANTSLHLTTADGRNFWSSIDAEAPYLGAGDARRNGAVVACVQRIKSRALDVPFTSADADVMAVLDDPAWVRPWDRRHFWSVLYEAVLYDGNAGIAVGGDGRLRVGKWIGRAEGAYRSWQIETADSTGEKSESKSFPEERIGAVRWSADGRIPHDICRTEADAYLELQDDLYQEGRHARRVGSEIVMNEFFADSDKGEEAVATFRKMQGSNRKFLTPIFTRGMNFENKDAPVSPPHHERVVEAMSGVARVFGVPLPLLMTGAERAQTIEESDAHLLRDAVFPLVNNVASALTRLFGKPVEADVKAVGLPSKTGVAGYLMGLSQTGVMTINEVREQAGMEPHPDGDEFPQTAGAGERDNSGHTSNNDDSE